MTDQSEMDDIISSAFPKNEPTQQPFEERRVEAIAQSIIYDTKNSRTYCTKLARAVVNADPATAALAEAVELLREVEPALRSCGGFPWPYTFIEQIDAFLARHGGK